MTIASGFVIDATGIVVTNFHVVNAPDSPILAAMTATGEVVPVIEILAVSPLADIAICRIAKQGLPPLACLADARPGCRLHALSHPDAARQLVLAGRFIDDGGNSSFSATAPALVKARRIV